MHRRIAPLLLTSLLVVASAVAASASVAGRSDEAAARAKHDRIVAFWTPGRMRSAVPRDFTVDTRGAFTPAARGAKGKPGGGSGTVTGASWTKGGEVLERSGRVYFVMGGTAYICSGAVVDDGSRSAYALVLTAAHCAYDETEREFATQFLFIPSFDSAPSYDCDATALGCWTAQALVVDSGYATAGGFNSQATTHDWAFAVMRPGGDSGSAQLDATVGAFGISFSTVVEKVYAFGYPAAGKYGGSDLIYCAGTKFSDSWNGNKTWGLACDQTGGASGGPWLKSFEEATGVGTLDSVNSYKYSGRNGYMYGPKFDSKTSATYTGALSATANTIVAVAP